MVVLGAILDLVLNMASIYLNFWTSRFGEIDSKWRHRSYFVVHGCLRFTWLEKRVVGFSWERFAIETSLWSGGSLASDLKTVLLPVDFDT